MKIIRFEPGDGTSYSVLYHPLTDDELDQFGQGGIKRGSVLYGFNARSHATPVAVFAGAGYLDLGYYLEKLPSETGGLWTALSGYRVLGYLTGREIELRGTNTITRAWDSLREQWGDEWKQQIDLLRQQ